MKDLSLLISVDSKLRPEAQSVLEPSPGAQIS